MRIGDSLLNGRFVLGVLTLLVVTLGGCQTGGSHATSQPTVPRGSSAELVMYISDQAFVTAEPGYRAVYTLAYGKVDPGEFDQLVWFMRNTGLISGSWRHDADTRLNRAAVGFMICRACDIRSGVGWNLTGLGRYAWRELQYKGIARGGGESGLVSGGEFVGILSRADAYMRRTGRTDEPAVELEQPAE